MISPVGTLPLQLEFLTLTVQCARLDITHCTFRVRGLVEVKVSLK